MIDGCYVVEASSDGVSWEVCEAHEHLSDALACLYHYRRAVPSMEVRCVESRRSEPMEDADFNRYLDGNYRGPGGALVMLHGNTLPVVHGTKLSSYPSWFLRSR